MTEASFRKAGAEDWSAIWPIFAEVVARSDTYTYSPTITEAEAKATWMQTGPKHRTFVAELDGQIVGTAILKPNQPSLGDHVANAAWMISSEASGRGIGRAFANYVIDEARALGFLAMQFNAVVSTNTRAIALWQSLGFATIGTVPAGYRHHSHGLVDLLVMHREL